MESAGRPSLGQILLLASSSAATAIFYSIYRSKLRTAQTLKGARHISLDDDLPAVLMDLPGKCVPYAVIEGAVRAVKDSLSSQFMDNCKGVIHRLSLKEHKMVWNRTTHLWNDQEKVIHQRTNTVPFELARDDDGGRGPAVRVLRPLDAAELDLETVYEKYHPALQSFSDTIGHFLTGERPKGVQETEEMLRLGAGLTGVGELVLDNGAVKLQPPRAGAPYYLSRLDFQALVQRQEARVRLWRALFLLCGAAACLVIFFALRREYRRRREGRRLRELRREFLEAQQGVEPEEEEAARDACAICFAGRKACVFLECGHVCSCHACYLALPQPKKCPICRHPIARMVPLYNS
ncbi:mitochondrial ubiquitin ligase activator of NFKB 1 [Gastrophryne carolinensis]